MHWFLVFKRIKNNSGWLLLNIRIGNVYQVVCFLMCLYIHFEMRPILKTVLKKTLKHCPHLIRRVASIWSDSLLTFFRKELSVLQFPTHGQGSEPQYDTFSEVSSHCRLGIYVPLCQVESCFQVLSEHFVFCLLASSTPCRIPCTAGYWPCFLLSVSPITYNFFQAQSTKPY